MYGASIERPRSGLGGAVFAIPAAFSSSSTPVQHEASAKAPCTRTTVKGAPPATGVASVMFVPSLGVATGDASDCEEALAEAGNGSNRETANAAAAAPAS